MPSIEEADRSDGAKVPGIENPNAVERFMAETGIDDDGEPVRSVAEAKYAPFVTEVGKNDDAPGGSIEGNAALEASRFRGVVKLTRPRAGVRSHELYVPLAVDGTVIETVTIRPATLADVRGWEEDGVNLFEHLTGLHADVMAAMVPPDAEAVAALFRAALPADVVVVIEGGR